MHQTKNSNHTEEFLRMKELQELEQRKIEKLEQRFNAQNKPWHLRNKGKRIYAFIFSYVFNFISILGLGYAFTIAFELIGVQNKYLGYAMAVPLMILFEMAKRYFSDAFWDFYHASKRTAEDFFERISWSNALMNFVVLFGLSLAASIFGNYYLTKENAPEAKYLGLSDDVNASALLAEVEEKKEDYQAFITDPGNHNSKGQFYYKLLGQKDKMLNEIQDKEKLLNDTYGIVLVDNKQIKEDWQNKNRFRIYFVLIITLLSELFFEICMSFMSRYDFERYKLLKLNMAVEQRPIVDYKQNGYRPKTEAHILNEAHARTRVIGLVNRHTDADTQTETRVPRGTQHTQTHRHRTVSDTHTQPTKKITRNHSYYPGIVKTLRERWARHHVDHPRAPKSGSTRKGLYDNAMLDWQELESVGYKIKVNPQNKFNLIIESPKNIEI